MKSRENLNFLVLSFFLDIASILISYPTAYALYQAIRGDRPTGVDLTSMVIVVIWFVFANIVSIYDPRRNYRVIDEISHVIAASVLSFFAWTGMIYLIKDYVPRVFVFFLFFVSLLLMVGWRAVVRIVFRFAPLRQGQGRKLLFLGVNDLTDQLLKTFETNPLLGLEPVGYLSDDESADVPAPARLKHLGSLDDLDAIVQQEDIEDVVILLSPDHSVFKQAVTQLHKRSVRTFIMPTYFTLALNRAEVMELADLELINLRPPVLNTYQRLVKRLFDIVVASFLLVLAGPFMLIIAYAIRRDSEGPAIFRQIRIGENGRKFTIYKFRTMYIDAEKRLHEVIQYDEQNRIVYKTANDPRVTRLGRLLRRTSLDELPQLFNVLRGNMSLVGPRPELPWLVDQYEPWQYTRLTVPQGITGWWQINGRSDKPMHLHVEDDLYYIQNYSLMLDMIILWKTGLSVFKRTGAF